MSEGVALHFEHASDDPAASGTPPPRSPPSATELRSALRELVRATQELQNEIALVEKRELAQVSGSAMYLHKKAMGNAVAILERQPC